MKQKNERKEGRTVEKEAFLIPGFSPFWGKQSNSTPNQEQREGVHACSLLACLCSAPSFHS